MRTRPLSFSLAVALIALMGCGGGGSGDVGIVTPTPATPAAPTATTSVAMQSIAFNPPDILVSPGATVTWTNNDGILHNVTFQSTTIAGTGSFATGARSVIMPTVAGKYGYSCTLHPGMNGSVTVQ